jgi:hypothetical protein
VAGAVFASAQDPSTRAEISPGPGAGTLDVMFLGCVDVANCGNVCSLLAECLQDVSFAALVLRIFASYCFVFNSRLFFNRLLL